VKGEDVSSTRAFEDGDEVVVVEGDFKGRYGQVMWFELGRYMVRLPEVTENGHVGFEEHELAKLDDESEPVREVSVHSFPIPQKEFERHLEYLLMRSMEHVGEVGPHQALFGYQEFEGKDPGEILVELMDKLEQGMGLFAQAHIMIGRIVLALEHTQDGVTDAEGERT
jgi:hypothetical protein